MGISTTMTISLATILVILSAVYLGNQWVYFGKVKVLSVYTYVAIISSLCFLFLYTQDKGPVAILIPALVGAFVLLIKCGDKECRILRYAMFASTGASFAVVICILVCLAYKSKLFFSEVPLSDFLFGTTWNPDSRVINGNLVGSFGILPLLSGTLLIVIVSITIALPVGLLSAIYISEYSDKKVRRAFNTLLEILCGIPTVVYGYFAVVFLSPNIRSLAEFCGLNAKSENALAAGLAIGIMLLPYITLLIENALRSVPKILRYGSMALGATRSETTWHIVIPYALPDICSSVILSISRVIGETMIVLMAAGVTANLTFNPLHSITTITVQIATILTGDQNFQSIHTSSAYSLGLTLFVITWILNLTAAYVTKKTRTSCGNAC